MKTKEYLILTVVIVLLGTYLFMRSSDRSQYRLPTISPISGKEIDRIEITSLGKVAPLTRSGDQWQIGEKRYPADRTKVDNILNALEALTLTALVSEADAYARYDLSDEKKKEMRAEHRAIRDKYEKLATVNDVVDHIEHVIQVIGVDHVGIGTDFDGGGGVEGCKTVAEMKNITIELLRRGYKKNEIAKIWGGNIMRVLKENELKRESPALMTSLK